MAERIARLEEAVKGSQGESNLGEGSKRALTSAESHLSAELQNANSYRKRHEFSSSSWYPEGESLLRFDFGCSCAWRNKRGRAV